jgi:hypothetical protein
MEHLSAAVRTPQQPRNRESSANFSIVGGSRRRDTITMRFGHSYEMGSNAQCRHLRADNVVPLGYT